MKSSKDKLINNLKLKSKNVLKWKSAVEKTDEKAAKLHPVNFSWHNHIQL